MFYSTFYIVQGDTKPALTTTLEHDGIPQDLTGSTVEFHMSNIVVAEATVTDASAGQVMYQWQPGDTDIPGLYIAEFEVTYPDGTTETFPNIGALKVFVRPQEA